MADSGVSGVTKRPEGSNGDGPQVTSSSTSTTQHKRRHGDEAEQVGSSTDEHHQHPDDASSVPHKKNRLAFGLARPDTSGGAAAGGEGTKASPSISIKFGAQKPKEAQTALKKMNVFNADDEDDEEEMPPEAKMRMRNLGRETPTSTGPNSFGKTKSGFCDTRKIFDKNEPGTAKGSKELKKS